MANQVMTAASHMSAAIPELWSAAFYPSLLEKLVFQDLISKNWEGEISQLGDTVNISQFPQFDAASEITEDEAATADAVSVTNIQLVINKQVIKDYILTSKAQKQSLESGNQLRDLAMHSIMKKMQAIIIALIVPNAATPDHAIAYDSSTTLALADILEAKDLLDAQDVPDDGSRSLVCGSAQYNDLFNITGFTSRDYIPAGSPLTAGAISTPVLGFNVKSTTEVGNSTYLFHPSFMTMAVQQAPEVKVFDLGVEGKRAERVNMTVLFGVKQLDGLRVVSLS